MYIPATYLLHLYNFVLLLDGSMLKKTTTEKLLSVTDHNLKIFKQNIKVKGFNDYSLMSVAFSNMVKVQQIRLKQMRQNSPLRLCTNKENSRLDN